MNTVLEWGTVSGASLVGMVFSLTLSIVLPVALLILVKVKLKANLISFIIGSATFIVFALMLEPILHSVVLTAAGTLLTDNIILYGLYGGLAAALFEETGRLLAMQLLKKKCFLWSWILPIMLRMVVSIIIPMYIENGKRIVN